MNQTKTIGIHLVSQFKSYGLSCSYCLFYRDFPKIRCGRICIKGQNPYSNRANLIMTGGKVLTLRTIYCYDVAF